MIDYDPLVSICCITYNHATYIRQCLDGFLMQKTNFLFEIIINDDCSTDGTTEIIQEYAERYPKILKPIYHDENQYQKGCRGIFSSFVYPHAKGKYIALCEGDDYWIDPLKLQKQVDFMESQSHPDYSMCCSDALILTNGGELDFSRYKENTTIPFCDLILGGGLYIQTATLFLDRSFAKTIRSVVKNVMWEIIRYSFIWGSKEKCFILQKKWRHIDFV